MIVYRKNRGQRSVRFQPTGQDVAARCDFRTADGRHFMELIDTDGIMIEFRCDIKYKIGIQLKMTAPEAHHV